MRLNVNENGAQGLKTTFGLLPSPQRLEEGHGARAADVFGVFPREETSRECLQSERRAADLQVTFASVVGAIGRLDLDDTRAEFLRTELFQIGDLTGAKEDLRVAELVLVRVGDETLEDVLARSTVIAAIDQCGARE